MRYVIITMVASAPVLTLFAFALLAPSVKDANNERFISELASSSAGNGAHRSGHHRFDVARFASNTAIIGSYHVFLALTERGFMPRSSPSATSTSRRRRSRSSSRPWCPSS